MASRSDIAVAISVSRTAIRVPGLFGRGWCLGVVFKTPFSPPAFDRRGEPCGDIGMRATEDTEADVEEEGEEEDGNEDNGELGTVSADTRDGASSEMATYN